MMIKNFCMMGLGSLLLLGSAQAQDKQRQGDGKGEPMLSGAALETKKCIDEITAYETPPQGVSPVKTPEPIDCYNLRKLSTGTFAPIPNPKEHTRQSLDGKITCVKTTHYTIDYEPCEKALKYYNSVINAEAAMDLQQKIRTDNKNKNLQADANKKAAEGDLQTGMYDAAIASNNHQKNMQQEKMAAYGLAVGALGYAYKQIPEAKEAIRKCADNNKNAALCGKTLITYKPTILGNQNAKAALTMAMATFTAKAIAAGIAMGKYNNAAQQIAAAKKPFAEEAEDMMLERCTFNPTDPACAKEPGTRVPGQTFTNGDFGLDGTTGNNAFDMTPESDTALDPNVDPIADDGKSVAGVNSPFVDEAKRAKDIINPAGAAQMQASGGAGSGASPGGAGGPGGESAQLGSDLSGQDKDGDKEPTIKAGQVSGNYSQAGGQGYKGVGGGKDDANPFASLFDAKSEGGIEEDRSIASGDIDGAGSGLFQKISKRYGQMQADKRIEAKNLE